MLSSFQYIVCLVEIYYSLEATLADIILKSPSATLFEEYLNQRVGRRRHRFVSLSFCDLIEAGVVLFAGVWYLRKKIIMGQAWFSLSGVVET